MARPKHRGTLARAIQHQERIKFHAQTRVSGEWYSQPLADFLAFAKNLLPEDKAKMFETLLRYPLKTNEVVGECFDRLSRVFDGRNPAFNYQFTTPEARDDWEWYRQEILNEQNVWAQAGWENFKTEINSVLIVDLPAVQDESDPLPRPYFYWLPITDVYDYKPGKDGSLEWIAFKSGENEFAVVDGGSWRVYRWSGSTTGQLIREAKHGLGYCPARFFWDEPLSLIEPDIKASPLSRQLEALDWYLFFVTSKRNLDLYGAYPILSGYEQSCDWSDEEGDTCCGGLVKKRDGFYKMDANGVIMRCPKCGNKRISGVGSFVEIPIPDGKDQPDLRNPVQMLTVDRQSLDYNVSEEKRLRKAIVDAVTGGSSLAEEQTLTESQVTAAWESRSAVLNRVKKGFESAQDFVDSTVCRLRYGSQFVSARVNYGTDFYTLTTAELRDQYAKARQSGASEAELDALQGQIVETQYRNNPTQLQRMLLLAELEPFRHLTREEVQELYEKGMASRTETLIKEGFMGYIRKFERENTNILEFGSALPFRKKVDIIANQLKEYAKNDDTERNLGGDGSNL